MAALVGREAFKCTRVLACTLGQFRVLPVSFQLAGVLLAQRFVQARHARRTRRLGAGFFTGQDVIHGGQHLRVPFFIGCDALQRPTHASARHAGEVTVGRVVMQLVFDQIEQHFFVQGRLLLTHLWVLLRRVGDLARRTHHAAPDALGLFGVNVAHEIPPSVHHMNCGAGLPLHSRKKITKNRRIRWCFSTKNRTKNLVIGK